MIGRTLTFQMTLGGLFGRAALAFIIFSCLKPRGPVFMAANHTYDALYAPHDTVEQWLMVLARECWHLIRKLSGVMECSPARNSGMKFSHFCSNRQFRSGAVICEMKHHLTHINKATTSGVLFGLFGHRLYTDTSSD